MSTDRNPKPRKPATLRNCLLCASLACNALIGAFAYGMFTGNVQRGVPYDVVKLADEAAGQALQRKDQKDMAAAFQYEGKR